MPAVAMLEKKRRWGGGGKGGEEKRKRRVMFTIFGSLSPCHYVALLAPVAPCLLAPGRHEKEKEKGEKGGERTETAQ